MDNIDSTFAALTAELTETFTGYEADFAAIEAAQAPKPTVEIDIDTKVTVRTKSGAIRQAVVIALGVTADGRSAAQVRLVDSGKVIAVFTKSLRVAA